VWLANHGGTFVAVGHSKDLVSGMSVSYAALRPKLSDALTTLVARQNKREDKEI
jgi:hypothetical protein